ncbi:MAG: hypothetical protein BMS9Abin07_1009 [Acidimicrobiia bacterium]|nr:MAG: hypothetical protein BMS9Abin07_1009 [Acidimicrobiia bacterium]
MLEISLLVALFAGLTLVVGRLRDRGVGDVDPTDRDFVDLPCPWCNAQTTETDSACPSCHQVFGVHTT